MGKCGNHDPVTSGDPCRPPCACAPTSSCGEGTALEWFDEMIPHCLEYAQAERERGRPIVGILCEYTPRELLMAAGAVPVCLCGGSADTIPAAEEILPANLCPLIKSTFGYHVDGTNPFLEMSDLIVAETTCDGKKKMYELMAESRSMYVLDLPQKQNDADALAYWTAELHKFRAFLERRYRVEVTDEQLWQAIDVMNRERGLRRRLAEVMKSPSPPFTGRQLLRLKSSISGIAADLSMYETALAECRSAAVDQPDPRVRVLMTGVPIVHGAERVVDIIEKSGGIVVAMENCTGLKPILDDVRTDVEDPIAALAEKYYHLPCSVMTRNDARLDILRDLAMEYRAECIIELVWQACLTYSIESHRVQHLAEWQLDLPYLCIETDYSPSDSARIAVRVEALLETVRSRD